MSKNPDSFLLQVSQQLETILQVFKAISISFIRLGNFSSIKVALVYTKATFMLEKFLRRMKEIEMALNTWRMYPPNVGWGGVRGDKKHGPTKQYKFSQTVCRIPFICRKKAA